MQRAKEVRAAPSPDAKRVPCEQHLAYLCGKSRSDDSSRLHRRRLRQPKVPGETPETLYVTLYDRNSFSFHFHVFLFFARRQENFKVNGGGSDGEQHDSPPAEKLQIARFFCEPFR